LEMTGEKYPVSKQTLLFVCLEQRQLKLLLYQEIREKFK
jgi:hypothetical protein